MEFDLTKPYCRYFNEMLQIPHGSFNEKAISDWVVAFAKEHNLKYYHDKENNVVIYKDGTKHLKNAEPIILQGHLDMVCQKTEESKIDFTKDALEVFIDGDYVKAKNTTLGADNGLGLAIAKKLPFSIDNTQVPILSSILRYDLQYIEVLYSLGFLRFYP